MNENKIIQLIQNRVKELEEIGYKALPISLDATIALNDNGQVRIIQYHFGRECLQEIFLTKSSIEDLAADLQN